MSSPNSRRQVFPKMNCLCVVCVRWSGNSKTNFETRLQNMRWYFQVAVLVLIPLIPAWVTHHCCSVLHISSWYDFTMPTLVTLSLRTRVSQQYDYISEKVQLNGVNTPTSAGVWDPISCAALETFHPLSKRLEFCHLLNIKKGKYENFSGDVD